MTMMMTVIKEYLVLYAPTILEAVLTGVLCGLMKKLASHSGKIDEYKQSMMTMASVAKGEASSQMAGLRIKYDETIKEMEYTRDVVSQMAGRLESLVEENAKLRQNIASLTQSLQRGE